jgi:hypothetical protein
MEAEQIRLEMARILAGLRADGDLSQYLGPEEHCPAPYRGPAPIRLVVLGQDPTVRSRTTRARLDTVLDLNRGGNLRAFVGRIAGELRTTLDSVYATNVVKSFFEVPPTEYEEPRILARFAERWMGLLHRELAELPDVPVVTLGEPVLALLATGPAPRRVREYWGHQGAEPRALAPEENVLGRRVYPFPHQPSLAGTFYRRSFDKYAAFVRSHAGIPETVAASRA